MACGCGGGRNQASATPEQLQAAAEARAAERRALVASQSNSQQNAVANAQTPTQ
jgi:hypothetical protein